MMIPLEPWPIVEGAGGCWVLTPRGIFPITIFGIDRQAVEQLVGLLERILNGESADKVERLLAKFVDRGLRWRELDAKALKTSLLTGQFF